MTTLAQAQRAFFDALRGDGSSCRPLLEPGSAPFDVAARLALYQRGSAAAHINALTAIYPILAQVLGPRCFEGIATRAYQLTPSTQSDLNLYGGSLPGHLKDFVAQRPDLQGYPFLPDLAQLEWQRHDAFRALDPAPPDPRNAIDAEAASDVRCILNPSLRLLRTPHPVLAIWQDHQAKAPQPRVSEGIQCIATCRNQRGYVQSQAITDGVFSLLKALGIHPFLKGLSETWDPSKGSLPELIKHCLEQGWLLRCEVQP